MSEFNFDFDDTETSGIWWSTNVAIRDLCIALKVETSSEDHRIVDLLKCIAQSIEKDGL